LVAAAVAAAATLVGAVALAAETGHLPGAGGPPDTAPASAPGTPPDDPTTAGGGPRGGPAGTPPPGHGHTLSPTSAAVAGLCRAWDAQRRNPNGTPMRAEAMRDLAAAAGGEDRIPAFCAAVLAAQDGQGTPAATPHPGATPPTPGHPTGRGTARPTPTPGKKG
ncbi:hypothetical protein RB614_44155, partial [Phytohabitans sp. ZYX-F-186]|nr:hypothetical protein [Phytohabitans sp. ZYX-F-186]